MSEIMLTINLNHLVKDKDCETIHKTNFPFMSFTSKYRFRNVKSNHGERYIMQIPSRRKLVQIMKEKNVSHI